MYHYKKVIILLLALSIFSCREDSAVLIDSEKNPPRVQENFETNIRGYVTDADGFPITDALVSVINTEVETNESGYFELIGLVGEEQAVIKVEHNEYFNQFKTFIPSPTEIDQTSIRLIEKKSPLIFDSSEDGFVFVDGGFTMDFQKNSFVDEQGNPYQGEVKVFHHYIKPVGPGVDMNMPGNLMAYDADNELNLLRSFGMLNIELEGSNGETLDINSPATMKMTIPDNILPQAPSEIPLWYFDEDSGYWIEEGSAILEDLQYVGELNHFTFWNCDVPSTDFTLLKGQINNTLGIPMTKVVISDPATSTSYADWTDAGGHFDGYVPKNVPLTLELYDHCGGQAIHTQTIGPFTNDQEDIGIITISSPIGYTEISGILRDCDGGPISNGRVDIKYSSNVFPLVLSTDNEGKFKANIPACGTTEIEVTAYDFENLIYTDPIVYDISSQLDLGWIYVCGSALNESIIFVTNGEVKVITYCKVTITETPFQTDYDFETYDEDTGPGNPYVFRQHHLWDENSDLFNPDWWVGGSGAGIGGTIADSVKMYDYFKVRELGMIVDYEVLNAGTSPGEILSLKWNDTEVKVITHFADGSQRTDWIENSTVIINATVE